MANPEQGTDNLFAGIGQHARLLKLDTPLGADVLLAQRVHAVDRVSQASMAVVATMLDVLAGLDPLEQRLSPMESAGSFGIAADLIDLALAVEPASEKPALVLGTTGGQCAGVVVMPA